MNDGLKQRVVGALVLVVLGVIFLPMILDFQDDRRVDTRSQIPAKPNIVASVMAKPKPITDLPAAKSGGDVYQITEPDVNSVADTRATASKTTVLNRQGLPAGWIIQVISYSTEASANKFETRLQKAGFKSYMRAAKVSGKNYYRVYVGPFMEKRRADDAKRKIDKQYQVKSSIRKFEP